MPRWEGVQVDDFLVAIGKFKSNSVYHIAKCRRVTNKKNKRIIRHYLKCYKTDLITALRRDKTQKLVPLYWYKR